MTSKLKQAIAAVEQLPQARQDEIADALLEAATLNLLSDRIAAGEASFAESGGTPVQDVFKGLLPKYANS